MDYQKFSKQELVKEVQKINQELQESREVISAIQRGEVDAVVVHRDKGEQVYVLDDVNITYRRMIEEMNEGAVILNSEYSVLYCNKAFAGLIKYHVESVVSNPITNFINTEFVEFFQNISGSDIQAPVRRSIKLKDASAISIPVFISLHKIILAGMETFMMTVTDEREKMHIKKLSLHQVAMEKLASKLRKSKEEAEQAAALLREKNRDYAILNDEYIKINNKLLQANKELELAIKRAESSDHLKSAFIANMSHEIRTPLNSILGYTKILKNSDCDEEQKKHIDVIDNSGRNLLHLINDIVDLSKLESGEMDTDESAVFLNKLLNNIKTQFYAYAINKEKQKIDFRLRIPGNIKQGPVIYTDEFRLQQILSNLLSNAFKYTDKGFIEFGYELHDKKEIMFFVRDTGYGICKEDQENIFKRFRQGKIPSRQVVAGTGLGLAISKGLTKLLGGEIWMKSEPGKGSTFYLTVPFKEVEVEQGSELKNNRFAASGIPRLTGKRILLSEDDFFSREMMIYLLKKTNATLLVAEDGVETLRKFEKVNADLVLLDIRLPELDGYEVLKEIRSINPDTFVIAQTAYAMMDDIKKFREAGFTDYITKPVSDDELYSLLQHYLG